MTTMLLSLRLHCLPSRTCRVFPSWTRGGVIIQPDVNEIISCYLTNSSYQ